jgi:hypothetical protein
MLASATARTSAPASGPTSAPASAPAPSDGTSEATSPELESAGTPASTVPSAAASTPDPVEEPPLLHDATRGGAPASTHAIDTPTRWDHSHDRPAPPRFARTTEGYSKARWADNGSPLKSAPMSCASAMMRDDGVIPMLDLHREGNVSALLGLVHGPLPSAPTPLRSTGAGRFMYEVSRGCLTDRNAVYAGQRVARYIGWQRARVTSPPSFRMWSPHQ